MKVELRWPGWMSRQTVAAYTDLSLAAVDQYVKRGLLPRPHKIGEALRWSIEEIDVAILQSNVATTPDGEDPYDAGSDLAAQIHNQGRPSDPFIERIDRAPPYKSRRK